MILKSPFPDVELDDTSSLPDFMLQKLRNYGDRVAVILPTEHRQFTGNQIVTLIEQATVGLNRIGFRQRDVLASCVTNCLEFFVLAMAAQRLGGMVTTSNPAYTPGELLTLYRKVGVNFILTEKAFLPKFKDFKKSLSTLKGVISKDGGGDHAFSDLLKAGKRPQIPHINSKKDVAFLLFSSGTTGEPKAVMLSHYGMLSNTLQYTTRTRSNAGIPHQYIADTSSTLLSPFPFFHIGGICVGLLWAFAVGTANVIIPQYNHELFLGTIQKCKVNVIAIPPPIQVFLAKSPLCAQYDLSSLRVVGCGAAPVAQEVADEVKQRFPSIKYFIQVYGMTELGTGSHLSPMISESQRKLGSCGFLVPNTEAKVVDVDSLKPLGPGEKGELWVRGPQTMMGYFRNKEATNNTLLPDGFLRTGDIGYYDEEGYFFIVDRLKELIKVRGFQVAPAELEALLLTHPSIAEAAVVGIPDEYSGELPKAFVISKAGKIVTPQEVKDFVKGKVARFKELKEVELVEEIPKTPSGKILRRFLREKARKQTQKARI